MRKQLHLRLCQGPPRSQRKPAPVQLLASPRYPSHGWMDGRMQGAPHWIPGSRGAPKAAAVIRQAAEACCLGRLRVDAHGRRDRDWIHGWWVEWSWRRGIIRERTYLTPSQGPWAITRFLRSAKQSKAWDKVTDTFCRRCAVERRRRRGGSCLLLLQQSQPPKRRP